MTISQNERWVQIARLDEEDHVHVTKEYRSVATDLSLLCGQKSRNRLY